MKKILLGLFIYVLLSNVMPTDQYSFTIGGGCNAYAASRATLQSGTGEELGTAGNPVVVSLSDTTAVVSDTAYNATTWDAVTTIAPSKNAMRDKVVAMESAFAALISNTAFDMTSWDGVTTIAGSKNAIRDYMYLLQSGFLYFDQNASPTVTGEFLYDNTVAGLDGGAVCFYDGTRIQYGVSVHTLPSDDNYVVTYSSGTNLFEMQPGGSASVAGTNTQVQFNDSAAMGADAGLTYNKTTDILTVVGGVTMGATATPAMILKDSDASAGDNNYSLGINATDTGDGSEDIDITEQIQIAGAATTVRAVNADEDYEIGTASMAVNAVSSLKINDVAVPTISSTSTFTNKRTTARVWTAANDATPDIDSDDYDAVTITAASAAITDVNMTGTETNFQKIIFRIKDDGTARAITWGDDFEDAGVALPTTTVISKLLTVGFIYNTVTSKWGCVAVGNET